MVGARVAGGLISYGPNAGAGLGHDRRERGLADLKRVAPQIVAVQLDEIEGGTTDVAGPVKSGAAMCALMSKRPALRMLRRRQKRLL